MIETIKEVVKTTILTFMGITVAVVAIVASIIAIMVKSIATIALYALLYAWFATSAWNVCAVAFDWPTLNYWQTVALLSFLMITGGFVRGLPQKE